MVIITYSTIRNFAEKHADAAIPLHQWYELTEAADWATFADIKATFPATDYVGNDRYVFNIKGNRYRLIAMIHFSIRTVYIRGIFTHADYDKIKDISNL